MNRHRLRVAAAALALCAATCSVDPLHDLGTVDDLAEAFRDDDGKPRLLLLLSPT